MRLVAIYNVWADFDILAYSLKNIEPLVDGVIIIASVTSNFGEKYPIPKEFESRVILREPRYHQAMHSETDKRNFGLDIARKAGYTHFLSIDADECYKPEEFLKAKERFKNTDLKGLVCPLRCYFKSPKLWVEDHTLVPFIHELTPTIKHEFNRNYPFAWINREIRIDPTRALNINSGVEYTDEVTLHHFSWIRSDFARKIRNSTARENIQRSTIMKDLLHAKSGYFCEYYRKTLRDADVDFNIPEYYEPGNSD